MLLLLPLTNAVFRGGGGGGMLKFEKSVIPSEITLKVSSSISS
jgi:hypothetical protein